MGSENTTTRQKRKWLSILQFVDFDFRKIACCGFTNPCQRMASNEKWETYTKRHNNRLGTKSMVEVFAEPGA
jgi:hypothetical protein